MSNNSLKSDIERIIDNSATVITADEIYSMLRNQPDPGRTQESIRSAIRELINDQTKLIGSTSTGYFKIRSKEDLNRALRYIESRIPELQSRADNLRNSWNSNNPNDQV